MGTVSPAPIAVVKVRVSPTAGTNSPTENAAIDGDGVRLYDARVEYDIETSPSYGRLRKTSRNKIIMT